MTKVAPLEAAVLRFGPFEIDPTAGELRRAGRLVKLQPQPLRLLALLASRSGELVTREEIRERLWGGETFVDFEQGENHCIRLIRLALGDDARSPRFVETVPRRGYRFIADPEAALPPALAPSPATSTPVRARRLRPRRPVVVGGAVLLLLLAVGLLVPRASPVKACPRLAVMPFVGLGDDFQQGLAGGLTYEITTELVRRGRDGVVVVSGLSSTRPATPPGEAPATRPVDADYLLEGSVQRVERRVRVTVQITDARRLTALWAETYDREAGDVLALRSALAREIIAEVHAKIRSRT